MTCSRAWLQGQGSSREADRRQCTKLYKRPAGKYDATSSNTYLAPLAANGVLTVCAARARRTSRRCSQCGPLVSSACLSVNSPFPHYRERTHLASTVAALFDTVRMAAAKARVADWSADDLERAAKFMRELDASSNSKAAFELAKREQDVEIAKERASEKKAEADRANTMAQLERIRAEEQRKTMEAKRENEKVGGARFLRAVV